MEVVYEDNHLLVVNKAPGEIVQGDKTGDEPLVETLKRWPKEKYDKPGNVFCGVVHRLDRPVGGPGRVCQDIQGSHSHERSIPQRRS